MALTLGSVFWMDDDAGGHYYIVITPPSFPEVLVVNLTTNGPRKDQACVVQPGEHPCLTQESVIAYDHANVYPTANVERLFAIRRVAEKDKASNDLLLKIWDGAFVTNRMTIRCRDLLAQTVPH